MRLSSFPAPPVARTRPPRGICVALIIALLLSACLSGDVPRSESETEAAAPSPPRLSDQLGAIPHPITTDSPRAQLYFDQGLTLIFGFNHEAAIDAFSEALRLDPSCGACHWGIGLALGPNINRPMGPEAAARAYVESQDALRLTAAGSRERAYAEALSVRYAAEPPEDRSPLDLAYANAMRTLHQADPTDVDAAALFAESLMDLYPWAYWTADGEPREFTQEIVATIEDVLEREPRHVGANHYYIHAVEEFYPSRGEEAADRLATLAPEAGHLVHMPSHIYWRVGRYQDAADINQRAAEADEKFFEWCGGGAFYQAAYYPHNVHFLWAAAVTEGRRELAMMTARKLAAATFPALEEVPILQEFIAIPMVTMARFGLWDSLLSEPVPSADHVYLTGIWQYTRGMAQLRAGRTSEARELANALALTIEDPRTEKLILAGGTSSARALLEIAAAHFEAEFSLAANAEEDAVANFRRAAALHDALPYMEPPPWISPPRQALGAVLLDFGRADEAEAAYRLDLEKFPKNGWSLFGLAESLAAKGDTARAEWARKGYERAWARADFELLQTRF